LVTYFDVAKAFDSILRSKLLHKLKLLGIKGSALNWFKTFLSKRKQFVTINGANSDSESIDYGVIQGSTLGPLLFLIYVNNLSKIPVSGNLYLFADDCLVFFEGDDWDAVFETAMRDIAKIRKWFDQNSLTVNVNKSKFMAMSLRDRGGIPINTLTLHSCGDVQSNTCNCSKLERVDSYKYLGVIIDDKLSWGPQIKYINGKLRKMIYVFSQLKHILNLKELTMTYFAYVHCSVNIGGGHN